VTDFGIYVHWPFCASKCPYCDFNSHVRAGGIDEARFVAAYVREIGHWAAMRREPVVRSVFFGGGTPSLMDPRTVGTIIDTIARQWHLAAHAEITLEANPSSVEAARFRGYRSAGVNRVSLGVQSFDDAQLRSLGRLHSAAEAKAGIAVARETFEPRQTPDDWRRELGQALDLAAGRHLSLYQLTIEPETPFAQLHAAGKLAVPDPDAALALYEITQEMTERAGLPAYEISNHAAPREESRHNLLYWRYGEYVGVGAGAHGRLILDGRRHAIVAEKQPERWLERAEREAHGAVEITPLSDAEQADEALLMGLRLAEGLDLDRLAAVGGLAPAAHAIDELIGLGLLEWCAPRRLRAAKDGRFVLNEVVLRLASALEPVQQPANVS
jgi:putative oxygen-independent coproporphyrinogen III oxidase